VAEQGSLTSGVADRYASALFELALSEDQLGTVERDMAAVGAMFEESDDFRRLARSPVFSTEEQAQALGALFDKAGIGGLTRNFFLLVARNRRLFVAPQMVKAFAALAAKHRGEVLAEVTSAEPLSETHLEALREALGAGGGGDKNIRLETKVDPALIGGLIVKLGSRMIDTSLRTKLYGLRSAMKEAH
jgi:F-type H+-transporting ATPase subunit delta